MKKEKKLREMVLGAGRTTATRRRRPLALCALVLLFVLLCVDVQRTEGIVIRDDDAATAAAVVGKGPSIAAPSPVSAGVTASSSSALPPSKTAARATGAGSTATAATVRDSGGRMSDAPRSSISSGSGSEDDHTGDVDDAAQQPVGDSVTVEAAMDAATVSAKTMTTTASAIDGSGSGAGGAPTTVQVTEVHVDEVRFSVSCCSC